MNLDRFSQPMSWENMKHIPMDIDDQVEENEEIRCACGCGYILDIHDETDYVESVIWEDEFISNDPACVERYNNKQKKIALQSNLSE